MAERGPGGREVGRVSLRVLPDTSNFLPSLKRYAERVERTVAIRIGTSVDTRGLEADVAAVSERIERTVPKIKVPATPVTDGFARDLQVKVRAAAKAIEANIPLTADGEGFRRQIRVEVARIEAEIARLDVEVPLNVEDASKAKAELRAKVAELQLLANMHGIDVPVSVGGGLGGSGFMGLSPALLASLSGIGAVLAGSAIASLPALIASIAAPVGVIALGFEGIKNAAILAKPAFEAMRDALSGTFASALMPVFSSLAEVLPKITPQLQMIAEALSGAFGEVVRALASPDGIAALQGVFEGIAEAITILAPSLGPMTTAFLQIAETGMAAFVKFAPTLNDALLTMTNAFTYLNDSGIISYAAQAFAGFVVAAVVAVGAIGAILVVIGAAEGKINEFRIAVARAIGGVVAKFNDLVSGVSRAIQTAVGDIGTLPSRVVTALGDLGGLLYHSGAALIQGLIDGILSKLGPVGTAVQAIAQAIKDHFPGSPVKTGPLTGWNNGGAGKRLGSMLADGLDASRETVRSASANLASAVQAPSLTGAGVTIPVADGALGRLERQSVGEDIADALRKTTLAVGVRDVTQAVNHKNAQRARG